MIAYLSKAMFVVRKEAKSGPLAWSTKSRAIARRMIFTQKTIIWRVYDFFI
jgi:hypothetical protein